MLKVGLATEVLPVRVFNPGANQICIRAGNRVPQLAQPSNQARRTGGPTRTGRKECRPAGFKHRPVDQLRQFHQRMFEIDQFSQGLQKQVSGRRIFAFGPHRKLTKICKESRRYYLIFGKCLLLKFVFLSIKTAA